MKLHRNFVRVATVGLLALTLVGCAHHDRKTSNTLMGAGLGAAAGAVVTGGDPLYTLGGAAAGGLLGNVLTEDRQYRGKESRSRGRGHKKHHRGRR
ncbi:hypothetical protein [Pollutimonas thiosulfatoxidans]|uniref:Glycine zipper 2TM domain-containing protein n=1 Tax=Pollutimonas thiosulfatoxidans TaxID=2028345 RepID=A0A410GEK5_9BURK|nr:hypothetical protein [Pollutimonas thiosulfatoxidans]QAA94730.1 hypothetical protein CKA81_13410 [Pollutimonas thiosulfatoxidans]